MPFDASGTFTRFRGNDSWKGDAASADKRIKSDIHDINDNDLANGLSECITRTGKTQPTADIPMGGHKIINLAPPVAPSDAATKAYVDNPDPSSFPKNLGGADVNGRLNFTSPTGVNGITWSSIGAAWVARLAATDRARNRVVLNNDVDPAVGTDVIAIDETNGSLAFPTQFETSTNLIFDGTSWRTPVAGAGYIMRFTGGVLSFLSNFTATTLAYGVAALESWFRVSRQSGSVVIELDKQASGHVASLRGLMGGKLRWNLQLGNSAAEDATFLGSDFVLTSYNNAGTGNFTVMSASRKTGEVNFPQGLSGNLVVDGSITSDASSFASSTTTAILSTISGGTVYLRPNGPASAAGQTYLQSNGDLTVTGYMFAGGYTERPGVSAGFGTQKFNSYYASSVDIRCYVGNTFVGTWTPACDHRIKKDIRPLPGSWDKVKALRPVSYTDAAFGADQLFVDGDTERWGFLAHELQEALLPSAASGEKDGPELQQPSVMSVLAALCSALQEAQVRIEALEARG
jgi:hypothetical protein